MSDQEKFLTRWSRRKRDAADENAQAGKPAPGNVSTTDEAKSDQSIVARPPEAEAQPALDFDLAKLPLLESIGADSDITAFFQPGVPSALKHAALRRVWAADPAIRDFVGLAENAWDFTDPEAMPGFGALDPKYDVKKLVAELFREAEPEPKLLAKTPASVQVARLPDKIDPSAGVPAANEPARTARQEAAGPEGSNLSQGAADGAMQQGDSSDSNESFQSRPAGIKPRRHGSAIPH